ncbi:MAG: hypothetical protein ACK5GU_14860 [Chloroflexota bacterium]|jgi:hypothetical protein
MDPRKRQADIWYAAEGHKYRRRAPSRGCCLGNVVGVIVLMLLVQACVG